MDFFKAVIVRRSIREYKSEPIADAELGKILEAGRLAPSAGNRQPWRFIVVKDQDRKEHVAEAANRQSFIGDAAAVVVGIADPEVSAKWHEKDTMIALEHIALAATALGYGTCWIGAFDEDALKALLSIPRELKIVALLPIGVSNEKPGPRPRKDFHELFFKDEWQTPLVLTGHHPRIET